MRDQERLLLRRAAFSGVPLGEVEMAADAIASGADWDRTFVRAARRLRRLAVQAEADRRTQSATQAWQWTAAALHAASYGLHFTERRDWLGRARRMRRMAVAAHRRALALDGDLGRPVQIDTGGDPLRGYLRLPAADTDRLVVMVNGLDSMTEVELHAFGRMMVERGMAVLGLDVPWSYSGPARSSVLDVENVAPAVADWAAGLRGPGPVRLGAFGVSFGGHLVARLMAGDARFSRGVLVSPNAYFDDAVLAIPRIRRMLAVALDRPGDQVAEHARNIDIRRLPAPHGRMLVLTMEQDLLFGPEHGRAFGAWAAGRTESWSMPGEHVGTSRAHVWLPWVADWLAAELAHCPPAPGGFEQEGSRS